MSFTYLNLQGTLEHITVTSEEIDRQMQRLLQANPRIVPVTGRAAALGDELVLDYNLEHNVPDMDEVHDYLTERMEEMPFGSWSVGDDGDGDVCLTVYP